MEVESTCIRILPKKKSEKIKMIQESWRKCVCVFIFTRVHAHTKAPYNQSLSCILTLPLSLHPHTPIQIHVMRILK